MNAAAAYDAVSTPTREATRAGAANCATTNGSTGARRPMPIVARKLVARRNASAARSGNGDGAVLTGIAVIASDATRPWAFSLEEMRHRREGLAARVRRPEMRAG